VASDDEQIDLGFGGHFDDDVPRAADLTASARLL